MITVNQTKAINITKEKIRAYRNPKLAELDVAYQRATEEGTDTAQIVADKQVLRDMPATAEGKTVDELKTIIDSLEG